MHHRSLRGALLAFVAATALAVGALGPAQASESPESSVTTEVTYRGHTFTVPATWDVVDLGKDPDACVRFDRHAVYLGEPTAEQECPVKVLGRTEALLLEPGGSNDAQVTENRTSQTYWATSGDIAVTASYGDDREQIKRVLSSAELPVADALPAATAPAGDRPSVKAVPADSTSFQGKGFDKCDAPSTTELNAWKGASPYGAVGIYIGGVNVGCDPNFDAAWVQTHYENGWRFIPIYVGPQAQGDGGSCGDPGSPGCEVIDDPEAQGAASARDAAAIAQDFGFGAGSVLYYNMEAYTPGEATTPLVLPFLEAWTQTLHELGYRSGAYGSLSSLAADLVETDGSGYVLPDVINFAKWDGEATVQDPAIPDHMWAEHQRVKQYVGHTEAEPNCESHGGVELCVDLDFLDVGEGSTQPPVQKDTALAYDGPATVSNGSPTTLSATLAEKNGGAPIPDREVTLALGPTDHLQTCTANTDTEGRAACTIDKVDQPLNDTGTVPLTASFAGDDAYKASEDTAEVKLQYVTGRAYGLSARVPVLVLPITIAPTPDTGVVRAADAQTVTPACTQNISALVLTVDALCADVTTKVGPSSSTSQATVAKATLGLPGLPVIEASGITATSTSTCEASSGTTDLKLTVAGVPVALPDAPDYAIDLGAGAKIVVNEQTETADGLTVNALHITALGGADVVVASSTSSAHNCV
ncbi:MULTISPECIES: choice-of-anchor P family protein [Streptomyces]|uniref:choice-of-anchor P family protein n=1 Tax=Streptomyces TaxID=1883 RepID=UPI0036C96C4C